MIELARQYGRYGYRRIAALLRDVGWQVNDKRVERLWRREGLKVPQKQPKKGRLWLDDGSCIRLRAEYTNHVWSYVARHVVRVEYNAIVEDVSCSEGRED
jgi:putative transposase